MLLAAKDNLFPCWPEPQLLQVLRVFLWKPILIRINAPSDGPNMWPLQKMQSLLSVLKEIDLTIKKFGLAEAL